MTEGGEDFGGVEVGLGLPCWLRLPALCFTRDLFKHNILVRNMI
jgi:hypothetical protein